MAWKFVPSDKFDIEQLFIWEQFYIQDLKYSQDYLEYVKKMAKFVRRMKNGKHILDIAKQDVADSKWNLKRVREAIAIAKKRAL